MLERRDPKITDLERRMSNQIVIGSGRLKRTGCRMCKTALDGQKFGKDAILASR